MFVKFERKDGVNHIVDTDFTEAVEPNNWETVLRIYEHHNSKVAANMFRAIQWNAINSAHELFNDHLREIINHYCPRLSAYREEIDKYLILL
jgi:hypothetical protein